ncbi:MAG TPA: SH3 domain-containing protein [Candidatus Dormibacteraeota bacterium]
MSRIIRIASGASLAAATLLLAACSGGSGSTHTASSASTAITPRPSPSASLDTSPVWVLTPVGLNIRAQPDATSERLGTFQQGVQLDVLDRQSGAQNWLKVRGHDSGTVVGWVLDSPDLLIHRSVALHFDPNQGWSTLFPTDWTLSTSGAQTTFTGSGQLLSVVSGNVVANLPNTPLSAGHQVRQESPVEIYGKTTYITVYQLDAGGFEYDSSAGFGPPQKALLFSFRDTSARTSDTGLFKQLLASVIVSS